MKTVLVSAYAVNPYHGSEDGMGWNFILQIARFNKVIAVTRENTRSDIERYLAEHPVAAAANIQFEYYDLPYWARFWKKGGRFALLYYYLWQFFLPRHVKRKGLQFDIVHNLNFHNDWTPSLLWKLHKPFVWGPIGHHPRIPRNYVLHVYGVRAYLLEEMKWLVKKYFWKIDPLLRQTVNHADKVLTMNSAVTRVLGVPKDKISMMTSVSSEAPQESSRTPHGNSFTILSAGRFVPLKGFDITIKSFARFLRQQPESEQSEIKLVLVGDGPSKKYLERLTEELEISNNVTFIAWLHRSDFRKLYSQADLFLFPSHEGAGMVIAEALSYGLPVVCFRNEGPGELVDKDCGITIPYSRYDSSITRFAESLNLLYRKPAWRKHLSEGARKAFAERFDWDVKGEHLRNIYDNLTRKAG